MSHFGTQIDTLGGSFRRWNEGLGLELAFCSMSTTSRLFALNPKTRTTLFGFAPIMDLWNHLTKVIMQNTGMGPPAGPAIGNGATARHPKQLHTSDEQVACLAENMKYMYGFRVLETALLVLRMARSMDSRLQNASCAAFFQLLDEIAQSGMSSQSFTGKTVVTVEGLEGSGKSSLIADIVRGCSGVLWINDNSNGVVNDVRDVFNTMPDPILKAFEFAVNYVLAYEIVKSEYTVFIVESFHHAVCARNICEKILSEAGIDELPNVVFDWPFDLPVPELALFLSIPTPVRLKRLQQAYATSPQNQNNLPSPRDSRASVGTAHKPHQDKAAGLTGEAHQQSKENKGPRFSSSTVNERSGTRIVARDARANMVYSKVRGPGTVGLDASLSCEEVLATALEALEYFGVYAVSRSYNAHHAALVPLVEPFCSRPRPESPVDSVFVEVEGEKEEAGASVGRAPLSQAPSRRLSTAKGQNSRSSLSGTHSKTGSKRMSFGSGAVYSPENLDPQLMPELPDELITNRRISMGVYGMFTKL